MRVSLPKAQPADQPTGDKDNNKLTLCISQMPPDGCLSLLLSRTRAGVSCGDNMDRLRGALGSIRSDKLYQMVNIRQSKEPCVISIISAMATFSSYSSGIGNKL